MRRHTRRTFAIKRYVLSSSAFGGLLMIMTASIAVAQCGFESGVAGVGSAKGPAPNPSSGPPAIHSFGIHQDTATARDDMLGRRPVADGTKVPNEVPPLPGQRITPPASKSQ